MDVSLHIDDAELEVMIKEEYYRKIRRSVQYEIDKLMSNKVREFVQKSDDDFREMVKDAIIATLKEVGLRDVDNIVKILHKEQIGRKD